MKGSSVSGKSHFTAVVLTVDNVNRTLVFVFHTITVKCYIVAASLFHRFGMQKFYCILFSRFTACYQYQYLMGNLSFCGYLISPFCYTHKNLMHAEYVCLTVRTYISLSVKYKVGVLQCLLSVTMATASHQSCDSSNSDKSNLFQTKSKS